LRLSNKTLARKLGYGFSINESVSEDEDFIARAKSQVEKLPDFHPWKFIAKIDPSKIDLSNLPNEFQNDLDREKKKGIQKYLNAKGFYSLAIDGDLGKGSRKAISDWQASINAPSTGQLDKTQYREILLYQQSHGSIEELNFPNEISGFSYWNLDKSDLRYPDDVEVSVKHRLELNDERERLRAMYANGEIPDSEVQRLWWQRYNSFPWWRDTLTRAIDNVHGQSPILNRFWHFWINLQYAVT
jgi:hypothetical protein